jgi:hypothetical protein
VGIALTTAREIRLLEEVCVRLDQSLRYAVFESSPCKKIGLNYLIRHGDKGEEVEGDDFITGREGDK